MEYRSNRSCPLFTACLLSMNVLFHLLTPFRIAQVNRCGGIQRLAFTSMQALHWKGPAVPHVTTSESTEATTFQILDPARNLFNPYMRSPCLQSYHTSPLPNQLFKFQTTPQIWWVGLLVSIISISALQTANLYLGSFFLADLHFFVQAKFHHAAPFILGTSAHLLTYFSKCVGRMMHFISKTPARQQTKRQTKG